MLEAWRGGAARTFSKCGVTTFATESAMSAMTEALSLVGERLEPPAQGKVSRGPR